MERANPAPVLSVSFNDDCSCFAVGLNTGFRIFHTDGAALRTIRDFRAGVGLVQMMGKANYLGIVGGGRQPKFAANKLIVWDESKSKDALEISALTPVRGVQLSKERIVVVLQNSVRVYKFAKPPSLVAAYETANNPLGLCYLSQRRIAFPGRTAGHIQILEIATGNVSIIPAHSAAIRALQVSPDGELLATASETGTLIRVFSTSNCARLAELRRGIDPATIFSLAFNTSGTMLACTSDKSTLHIFDVPNPRKPGRNQSPESGDGQAKWGILSKIPMMPRMFSDPYSFASAPFELGDELAQGKMPITDGGMTLGTGKYPKGVIGWLTDTSLVVVGAGRDARWEKFNVVENSDGRRHCIREGWKRYMIDT